MADPNSADSLDETLQQPVDKPERTLPASSSSPKQADSTLDFSQWSWQEKTLPIEPAPLTQPASSSSSDMVDQTLVNAPDSAEESDQTLVHVPERAQEPRRTKVPEELDQTLVHSEDAEPRRTKIREELDQTLVHSDDDEPASGKPTTGPRPADTRAAEEPDQTLVHQPAAESPAVSAGLGAETLMSMGTQVHHGQGTTDAQQQGRPTTGPEPTTAPPAAQSPKGRSAQAAGDRYEVLGTLGRGGMGVVYKARDKKLNRLVALKMILSGAHASPTTLMRFQIEAEAVAKLQHPNIVQIFDIGTRDGHPFFSLEYLDGGSLHQQLEGAAQPPKRTAALIETLARAIHYAHLHGIVHRDMKPANVLLGKDGTLKITDFGLAKQLDVEDSGQTGTESILGTPTYMAPEQAAGRTKDVGPAADIYALGAMLYEMLTGRPPFRGTTIMETLQQVQFIEPIQPRRLQPNAPLDLQTICLKCLNKEPNKRYTSAEALADDLRAFLENRPITARPTPLPERLYKWMRRQPMQAALVAVCFIAACGLVYGVVHHIRQQDQLLDETAKYYQMEIAKREAEEGRRIQAERDEKVIKSQFIEVRDAKNLAETNLTLAQTNEKRAKENFTQAQAAVEALKKLAQESLVDKPGLEKIRDDLLNRVVVFYEEFIKTNPEESLLMDKGKAYRRLGNVQELLGKNDQAAKSFREAIECFNALLAKDDKDEEARRELAETSVSLWMVQEDLGKLDLSGKALDQAFEVVTKLHERHPEEGRYLGDLAVCHNNYGVRDFLAGKQEAAEKHFQDALKYLNQLQGKDAEHSQYLLEKTRVFNNLGLLYAQRAASSPLPEADRDRALDRYAQALNIVKPLVERFPANTKCVKELGAVYTNLGIVLMTRTDKTDAVKMFTEAVKLFGDLKTDYPAVTDYRHLLAVNQANRGDLLGQQQQLASADTDLAAASKLLEALALEFPKRPVYRLDLARTCNRLGVVLEAEQHPVEARQAWEHAVQLLQDLLRQGGPKVECKVELQRSQDFLLNSLNRDVQVASNAKRWPEAVAAVTRMVEMREKIAGQNPSEANKNELASTRLTLVELYISDKNTVEAEKTLTALVKNPKEIPLTWGKLHRAAVAEYQLIELADHDPAIPQGARDRFRKGLTEDCLLLLRYAIDRNEVFVVGANDFRTLRNNEDLRYMLSEIERKGKRNGEQP